MQPVCTSTSGAASSPPDLVALLRAAAAAIGFSRLGIAAVGDRDPLVHARFRAWLDAGHAGPMAGWLAAHEPLRRDPATLLAGVRSVIMLATDHPPAAAAPSPPGRGRVASYAWGDDYHDLLRRRVNALGAWLEERLPGCRTRGVVDSAPFAEREFGWLAGLGWFGKNTMLIDPRAGSHFFLAALLTDAVLPGDAPIHVDHCGTCTACLDACPTGALVEPRILDAGLCVSALSIEERGAVPVELRPGMGDWIFGCDECQRVCPWNRLAPGSGEPTFAPRGGATTLDLADLLALDEEGFRRRFRGSPLLRAERAGLARSAAVALGNQAASGDDAHARRAVAALAAALADPVAMVRGAAAWALGRWRAAGVAAAGGPVAARLAVETDAAVRDELSTALADAGGGPS